MVSWIYLILVEFIINFSIVEAIVTFRLLCIYVICFLKFQSHSSSSKNVKLMVVYIIHNVFFWSLESDECQQWRESKTNTSLSLLPSKAETSYDHLSHLINILSYYLLHNIYTLVRDNNINPPCN